MFEVQKCGYLWNFVGEQTSQSQANALFVLVDEIVRKADCV